MYFDTHAHLYSRKFTEDRDEMMARARNAGVSLAILPAVDSESHAAMLQLEKDYPAQTLAMIGLHPVSVKENFEEELAIVEKYLGERPWVAIGEIGMDLYWDKSYQEQQETAFRRQCQWAIERDLPICIHARESIDELLAIIDDINDPKLRGVFHCWTGKLEQATHAIERGFYLGIGGVVTFKNGGIGPVVKSVARDRILLETDAPYLAPAPKRGKRNETSYIPLVAEKIAEIWESSPEQVGRQTTANAWQLFELDRFAQTDFPWAGASALNT